LNSIPKHIYERIYDFLYIDPQWISECLKTHQVLNTKPYIVDWKKIREEEELKRIKQREKEEEARRQELSNKEPFLIEEEEVQDGKRTIFTINDDEPTEMINEEEKLEKSSGEEINEERMGEQPRKKLRIRENEAVMNAFRNLYDYRFGIEEEAKYDMEIEQERKESPVKK